MAQAVQRTKILRQSRSFFNTIHSFLDVRSLVATFTREHVGAFDPWVVFENLSRCVIQRDFLIGAAFRSSDVNKSPVEIHVIPLQPE